MSLDLQMQLLLAFAMFAGAALYSSVGHAGASAYIAFMALFSVPAAVMRPTALVLNIIVASLASLRYVRAGQFRWRALWPLLLGAVPMAFVGGAITLPTQAYRPLVGVVLLAAAARCFFLDLPQPKGQLSDPPLPLGVAIGAGIGMLAGLTGTGGGIFLSPIITFAGWSDLKTASGIAAVFILCNSAAGLLGNLSSIGSLPQDIALYAAAVVAGAAVGTTLGIRLPAKSLQKALGVVLVIAGLKLIGVY
jgi:hypothetical protein